MSLQHNKKLNAKKLNLYLHIFFRKYPSIIFILKWTILSTIIGCLIGSSSAGFLKSLDWATNYREQHPWIILFLPLGGLLIGLLYHYWGKDVEAGNNLLIDTINEPGKIIPFKMAPFVYLGTMITHFLGGSAGREGTALQMAGAIADQLSTPFNLSKEDRRILIISAIAAGFGSVFGTPLSGAIFGLEVFLIGSLNYSSIFPAFTSAIIADHVTKLWHTSHVKYHIEIIPELSFTNIAYAMIAGIIFGLCAASFTKAMSFTSGFFKTRITYPPLRPFLGGILIILAVWILGTTKYIGLGIPTIISSFQEQLTYDFAIKMALTILTLAAGFKGGEVTPLFFIGATLGSALSIFIPLPISLLAGMGFVAVFSGATNTPLACSIMGLELFGSECGIYVAIACTVAYLMSGHGSIYGRQKIGTPKNARFQNYSNKHINKL